MEPSSARRFHSYTFDAFAKGLVDRFGLALPTEWRPTPDYAFDFAIDRHFRQTLAAVPTKLGGLTPEELAQVETDRTYKQVFIGVRISDYPETAQSLRERAALSAWRYLLSGGSRSSLNFAMIGRLAEHMLATNPQVLSALRATYSFVFLDEFQDTTGVHYDLTASAFHDTASILTAVGDSKQSIMRWALALKGIVERYRTDFDADVYRPLRNYRAAPKLVKIVGHLSAAIEQGAATPCAVDDGKDGEGECRLLIFPDNAVEAKTLAGLLKEWVDVDKVPPREICILTRQKPEVYCNLLLKKLVDVGVHARIESQLQDILAEPVTTLLIDFFAVATLGRAPDSWHRLQEFLVHARGSDSDRAARMVAKELDAFTTALRETLGNAPATESTLVAATKKVLSFIGKDELRAQYPQYEQGAYLKDQLTLFIAEFQKCTAEESWQKAFDRFAGADSIPVMTVHKSKGLEYHTVVFVGFEDYVFRGFRQLDDDEETCAFFVALSREKASHIHLLKKATGLDTN